MVASKNCFGRSGRIGASVVPSPELGPDPDQDPVVVQGHRPPLPEPFLADGESVPRADDASVATKPSDMRAPMCGQRSGATVILLFARHTT